MSLSYEAVLEIVPGLHQRPPVLPAPDDPLLVLPEPPKQGFDLVLHIVSQYTSVVFGSVIETMI